MSDTSREYQTRSITEIREKFKRGMKRVLLWLATGGGKTFVFCLMVKQAVARGKRCIIVVRGRKLVDQASQRLMREQVPHGVLMANHWLYRPHLPVQVCSIDTLIARDLRPEADLIIIDEAHLATSEGYVDFLAKYPEAFVVAVTATPWTDKGLRHVAEDIVHPITMKELIDSGFLVGARYYAPSSPDLSNVKVSSSTKDYVTEDLAQVMSGTSLVGDVVEHWKKIVKDKPTLCFAVNVNHSKILVEKFLAAGISAEHVDANCSDETRNEVIKRLESGETKVVCNVGIFCTGVDIVSLGAVIMARPTKSRNLFIQQAGRGTRPLYAKGFDLNTQEGRLDAIASSPKPDFILLDHAGNIDRHDLPTEEPEVDLDGKQKQVTVKESKTCKICFMVYRGPKCPECGALAPEPRPEVKTVHGELVEIAGINPVLRELKRRQAEAKRTGKKPAWAFYKIVETFGLEECRPYLPLWFVDRFQSNASSLFQNSPWKGVQK